MAENVPDFKSSNKSSSIILQTFLKANYFYVWNEYISYLSSHLIFEMRTRFNPGSSFRGGHYMETLICVT